MKALGSEQPTTLCTQPTEMVAAESKLSAFGSAHPGTSYVHRPSSTLAEGVKLVEAESVQPRKALMQLNSRKAVAAELKLRVPSSNVQP